MHWNVNGWTAGNCGLRKHILLNINPDIVSLNETHLTGDQDIELAGYTWFGQNRKMHRRAVKGSGGVGILVKNKIFESYEVSISDKTVEGILGMRFKNRSSMNCFVIFTCYLPPEGSSRTISSHLFFSHLLAQIYSLSDVDDLYLCGDYNGRIGNLNDYIPDVDNVPPRINLDTSTNKYGDVLIEFLRDAKCCIVNGRLSGTDNFTSVSTRGRAVVDYIIVPHEGLNNCNTFMVRTPNELLESLGPEGISLLGDNCKVPDHSILMLSFQTRSTFFKEVEIPMSQNNLRSRIRSFPEGFLSSNVCNSILLELNDQLKLNTNNQGHMDAWYDTFCKCLYTELDKCVKNNMQKGSKRVHKPYWNRELQRLWDHLRAAERKFLKCENKKLRVDLRKIFKDCQGEFDKSLRAVKRKFNRGMSLHIDQLQTHNPQKFWNEINKLGPNKRRDIPMVVTLENGECCSDVGLVLQKWEKDFTDLFSGCNHSMFDEAFLKEVSGQKIMMESEMSADTYNCNFYLNANLTIEEVRRVVEKSKSRKATGIDDISYEVLKSPKLLEILFHLFQSCFDNGIIPAQWYKTIIKPIPKSSKNDPKLPLSYRGISLISNVYKLYSSLLNNRLTDHFERSGFLVDEQNGFRKSRSCIDHIYSVTTIVRARLQEKKSTYTCFIDFQKAFDWINRELLEYRLITSGVNGKFYAAIKALYRAPTACVQVNDFRTGWFPTHFGVKQGDVLSPTLFSMYVNDLAIKIRNSKLGVEVADMTVGILLYADDIVLLADCEKDLQNMLNIVADWCVKWRLVVNNDKTQIVHFRKPSVERSEFTFMFGRFGLVYAKSYKYLGLILDEHMNFKEGTQVLSDSAGRALGSVLNKVKACKDLGYYTYTQLYQSCVCPVSDYASGVWGFPENDSCNTVQNRAIRSFLGVHKLTPILAISGDMGWMPVNIRHKGEMLRLWNRLVNMSDIDQPKRYLTGIFQMGTPGPVK